MGNDIKCGCKCQHSSQDDEVSFPSGLGKNNNSTYKSFEKIIIEDTFPEIESKINNNIEHSDDDKINIEVYNDNNILNTSSHYSNREKKNMFKKHKEISNKEEENKHVNIITNFKPNNIKSEEEEKITSLVSIKKVNDNIESNNMNIDTLQNNTNNSNNISMPMTSSNEIHININRLNILTNDENFNHDSKQLEEIKEVLPYDDNEDAPQTIISSLNGNIIIVENEDESTKEKMQRTPVKKLNVSKSVSKLSISRNNSNKNIQKNNNYNFQSKIVSNSKSIEEDTLLQFLNHHQIQLIENNFNLFNLPQKMNLSMNPLYEDVIYYGDVQKLNHCDDLSKVSSRRYVNRFCAMTKNLFKIYHTKEKFISLQNPIISIEIAKIKKVSLISFNTDKTVNDYT